MDFINIFLAEEITRLQTELTNEQHRNTIINEELEEERKRYIINIGTQKDNVNNRIDVLLKQVEALEDSKKLLLNSLSEKGDFICHPGNAPTKLFL